MSRAPSAIERLSRLKPERNVALGLERIETLLGRLGDPHRRLPPVIHVAGTNGKGSTIAFLRAMLEAQGARVHVATSPHLVHFRERIRLAGTLVETRALNRALEEVEAANEGDPASFFELVMAAAFKLFAESPADYLLLEVGLGGRLDATNVVAHPLGTIITPVSIDHVRFLGDTLAKIAGEKAGILKRGAPAVIGNQPDEAMAVIDARAAELGVLPFVAGRDYDAYAQNGRLIYQDESGLLDLPLPRLAGPHQIANAAIAVAAVRRLALPISEERIGQGLQRAEWPARMQPIRTGRLRALLPRGHELWLDGGHNVAGARALAGALRDMARARPAPLVLVMGMLADKDALGFLQPFSGLAEQVLTLRIPGDHETRSAASLAELAGTLGMAATPHRSVRGALAAAALVPGARVVICGSLYLAGHVLKANGTPPA